MIRQYEAQKNLSFSNIYNFYIKNIFCQNYFPVISELFQKNYKKFPKGPANNVFIPSFVNSIIIFRMTTPEKFRESTLQVLEILEKQLAPGYYSIRVHPPSSKDPRETTSSRFIFD